MGSSKQAGTHSSKAVHSVVVLLASAAAAAAAAPCFFSESVEDDEAWPTLLTEVSVVRRRWTPASPAKSKAPTATAARTGAGLWVDVMGKGKRALL